jgi:hypothetical protein
LSLIEQRNKFRWEGYLSVSIAYRGLRASRARRHIGTKWLTLHLGSGCAGAKNSYAREDCLLHCRYLFLHSKAAANKARVNLSQRSTTLLELSPKL